MLPASELLPLLDHLAAGAPADREWREWRIEHIAGGANNLIYRATSAAHDLAIKWTIRDARDRAGREYAALAALREAGLDLAPAPLWLERERYPQPVVVQSWLAGDVGATPPVSDAEWQALLDHYLGIHTLTPAHTSLPIQPAVLNMHNAGIGLELIRQQRALLPAPHQPADLRALVNLVEQCTLPIWPAPSLTLCHVDPNTRNIIRRPGGWASVDWENSGWGDPAFEIADLMTHPAYAAVPPKRWEWLISAYCTARGDPGGEQRIRVYAMLMLVWWVARLARTLYEVPRGGDQRLAARPDGWQAETEALYQRYLALARAAA